MTIKELLIDILNDKKDNDYDIYIWIKWLSEKKMTCVQCRDLCIGQNRIPPCQTCVPTHKLINQVKTTLGKKGDK